MHQGLGAHAALTPSRGMGDPPSLHRRACLVGSKVLIWDMCILHIKLIAMLTHSSCTILVIIKHTD